MSVLSCRLYGSIFIDLAASRSQGEKRVLFGESPAHCPRPQTGRYRHWPTRMRFRFGTILRFQFQMVAHFSVDPSHVAAISDSESPLFTLYQNRPSGSARSTGSPAP